MEVFPSLSNAYLGSGGSDSQANGLALSQLQAVDVTAEEEGLDFDLQPHEVVARIETCALWLVQQVSMGHLPECVLSDPSSSFPSISSSLPPLATTSPSQTSGNTPTQTHTPVIRSLMGRHVGSADRFARLWSVLDICHELLTAGGAGATQRELHYRLKPLDVFGRDVHLKEAVQDAVLLLRVPRSSLGINCSSKGLVAGALVMRSVSTGETTDCSTISGGRAIPGNLSTIADMSFYSPATTEAVLIIEKDTVFQQLAADAAIGGSGRFILVTAKGVPDVASRAFLAAVHAAFPAVPLLGVVDWNPSGVAILNLYRHGSRRMAESARYALPAVRWLGVRSTMLTTAAGTSFQDLTQRDRALIPGLKVQLAGVAPGWVAEMEAMEAAGSKADIEAVYSSGVG